MNQHTVGLPTVLRSVALGLVGFGLAGFMSGCSQQALPMVGGTTGSLSSDGRPMSQMELTFYADSPFSDSPIAHGAVQADGTFELVNASRNAAIEIDAGRYRVTVESLGAEVEIPQPLTHPSTTPIRIDHEPPEPIDIAIPGLSEGM